jgi:hypothetical protein
LDPVPGPLWFGKVFKVPNNQIRRVLNFSKGTSWFVQKLIPRPTLTAFIPFFLSRQEIPAWKVASTSPSYNFIALTHSMRDQLGPPLHIKQPLVGVQVSSFLWNR